MSGVYLNDVSAEIAMRAALRYNLKRIRKADGYNTDIGDVLFDPPAAPNKIQNYPAVVVVFGEEVNSAESIDIMELTVPVFLYCHVREHDTPSLSVAQFKQDILWILGNYWMLPDETNVPTCDRATYRKSLPFARANGAPAAGCRMQVDVVYQQLTLDPSQN